MQTYPHITCRCTSCGKTLRHRRFREGPHKCASCMLTDLARKHAPWIREALESFSPTE